MGDHSCSINPNQNQNQKLKMKMKKGLWSPEEDEKLYTYITRFGIGSWSSIPQLAGLKRCGKSCRLRWVNYLRPDLKRGCFSQQEQDIIIALHQLLGNRWAQIAAKLPGRTDNEIKNFWNSNIKKKLIKQGVDPNTHKPITVQTKVHQNSTKFDCKQSEIFSTSSSSSSSSMAMAAELEQAFHLNNNGGLTSAYNSMTSDLFLDSYETGIHPIGLNCDLLAQYGQQMMNCETTSSSLDLSDNLGSRMMMDSLIKEEPREISSTTAGFQMNTTTKSCELERNAIANIWEDVQVDNAQDFGIYQMGFLSETLLGEYLDVFR